VPATLSWVADGSEGGCNSELGFCGMSGKSGGRGRGVTGAGAGRGLLSSGLGIVSPRRDVRLTGPNLVCSDELLGPIDWLAAMRGLGERRGRIDGLEAWEAYVAIRQPVPAEGEALPDDPSPLRDQTRRRGR
jgi:hypothetical protein